MVRESVFVSTVGLKRANMKLFMAKFSFFQQKGSEYMLYQTNQSINQPINQSINQSINHMIDATNFPWKNTTKSRV